MSIRKVPVTPVCPDFPCPPYNNIHSGAKKQGPRVSKMCQSGRADWHTSLTPDSSLLGYPFPQSMVRLLPHIFNKQAAKNAGSPLALATTSWRLMKSTPQSPRREDRMKVVIDKKVIVSALTQRRLKLYQIGDDDKHVKVTRFLNGKKTR